MSDKLNEKQILFCKEYILDFNATRAYASAYNRERDETSRVNGHTLLTNTNVQEYIAKLIKPVMDKLDINKDYVLKGLKEIAETAYKLDSKGVTYPDFNTMKGAYELLGKYLKLFTDRVESVNLNADITEKDEEEIQRLYESATKANNDKA